MKPKSVTAQGKPPTWSVTGMTTKRLQDILIRNREWAHAHPYDVYRCLSLARAINREIERRLRQRNVEFLTARDAFDGEP